MELKKRTPTEQAAYLQGWESGAVWAISRMTDALGRSVESAAAIYLEQANYMPRKLDYFGEQVLTPGSALDALTARRVPPPPKEPNEGATDA